MLSRETTVVARGRENHRIVILLNGAPGSLAVSEGDDFKVYAVTTVAAPWIIRLPLIDSAAARR